MVRQSFFSIQKHLLIFLPYLILTYSYRQHLFHPTFQNLGTVNLFRVPALFPSPSHLQYVGLLEKCFYFCVEYRILARLNAPLLSTDELYRAREALSRKQNRPNVAFAAFPTWMEYCRDIGLDLSTVHR